MRNKETNRVTTAELTLLVLLLDKFRFDYKMYGQVLRANNFNIERSAIAIQEKELNYTINLLS